MNILVLGASHAQELSALMSMNGQAAGGGRKQPNVSVDYTLLISKKNHENHLRQKNTCFR